MQERTLLPTDADAFTGFARSFSPVLLEWRGRRRRGATVRRARPRPPCARRRPPRARRAFLASRPRRASLASPTSSARPAQVRRPSTASTPSTSAFRRCTRCSRCAGRTAPPTSTAPFAWRASSATTPSSACRVAVAIASTRTALRRGLSARPCARRAAGTAERGGRRRPPWLSACAEREAGPCRPPCRAALRAAHPARRRRRARLPPPRPRLAIAFAGAPACVTRCELRRGRVPTCTANPTACSSSAHEQLAWLPAGQRSPIVMCALSPTSPRCG